MNEADIRREALRRLIQERSGGNAARFCDDYGLNPIHIRALIKQGSTKPFGRRAAQNIEKAVGLPPRYLETLSEPDAMSRIADAISAAPFLDNEQRAYFIGLLRSLRDKANS